MLACVIIGLCFRRWLFDSLDEDYMRELSVVGRVLCKHRGLLEFLCQACFANKPRIISTFNVTTGMCNNADADHQDSEDNRQLVSFWELSVFETVFQGGRESSFCAMLGFGCTC